MWCYFIKSIIILQVFAALLQKEEGRVFTCCSNLPGCTYSRDSFAANLHTFLFANLGLLDSFRHIQANQVVCFGNDIQIFFIICTETAGFLDGNTVLCGGGEGTNNVHNNKMILKFSALWAFFRHSDMSIIVGILKWIKSRAQAKVCIFVMSCFCVYVTFFCV